MGLSYICIHLADENDDQDDHIYNDNDCKYTHNYWALYIYIFIK